MVSMNKKIRRIKQHVRGMGVQPAVIDAVDMLCDVIEEMSYYVQLPVCKVQGEVSASVETSPVLETELPIPEDKGSVQAGKITIPKSKRKQKK